MSVPYPEPGLRLIRLNLKPNRLAMNVLLRRDQAIKVRLQALHKRAGWDHDYLPSAPDRPGMSDAIALTGRE